MPSVAYFMDGHREVRAFPGLDVGDPEYQFCKQFVIETALHLAELDLDLHEVYREYQKSQQAAATGQAPGAP